MGRSVQGPCVRAWPAVYHCLHGIAPKYLSELCTLVADVASRRQLRSASKNEDADPHAACAFHRELLWTVRDRISRRREAALGSRRSRRLPGYDGGAVYLSRRLCGPVLRVLRPRISPRSSRKQSLLTLHPVQLQQAFGRMSRDHRCDAVHTAYLFIYFSHIASSLLHLRLTCSENLFLHLFRHGLFLSFGLILRALDPTSHFPCSLVFLVWFYFYVFHGYVLQTKLASFLDNFWRTIFILAVSGLRGSSPLPSFCFSPSGIFVGLYFLRTKIKLLSRDVIFYG